MNDRHECKYMDLNNVYFVIGTSYAGKSTIVKNWSSVKI